MSYRHILLFSILLLLLTQLSLAATSPLVVIDVSQGDAADYLLATTLQGLANRSETGPRVFLLNRARETEWLDYCLRIAPAETARLTTKELLALMKPTLKGQVLYDPSQPWTIDLATTAAGLHDLVVSPDDLGLPTLYDFRNRWRSPEEAYRWAFSTLFPECEQDRVAMLPAGSFALRDFAVAHRFFVFAKPASAEDDFFISILDNLAPGSSIFGEASPEILSEIKLRSHYFVSAARAANLSFYSGIETHHSNYQYPGYLETVAPRYLTLIFDCSELDFAINDLPGLWDDPAHGAIPLGWALPPRLAELAPPIAYRYYADAFWSGSDQFVLGAGGSSLPATAKARSALDINGGIFIAKGETSELGDRVVAFAVETGLKGLFITAIDDLPPALYQGIPALAAPRVDSVEAAIGYLNRIPLERRCAALLLDARKITPADAAHIAANVSDRFVTVPPEEMLDIMRELARPVSFEPSPLAITAVDYTENPDPDSPISVFATFNAPEQVFSASVIYQSASFSLSFAESMSPQDDGRFAAEVPPQLQGGVISLRIRARDNAGRVTWSPTWSITIPRTDNDSDGLSDAEEHYLLLDTSSTDTDDDGLSDLQDPMPLRLNHETITYLGPVEAPSDSPYLLPGGKSSADETGRTLEPGQSVTYWLPLDTLSSSAPVVIALEAVGPARLALGADVASLSQQFAGELWEVWYSDILPEETKSHGVFVQIACPEEAKGPLIISSISLVSPPRAPSIIRLSNYPAHPGPEQSIAVDATVFAPAGIREVQLAYRVNGDGIITLPMTRAADSPRYQARIPALENRDVLEYWVIARDNEEHRVETAPVYLPIGGRSREMISLLARRDFVGDWIAGRGWEGAARIAPLPGRKDVARLDLSGGLYTVWMLAGGRGQIIEVYVGNQRVGSIDPQLPDGWQQIGRLRLESGRYEVRIVSVTNPTAPAGARPQYAEVLFSADASFTPPTNRLVDLYDSIYLLAPAANSTLSGQVELIATGAGNMSAAEFSLDEELLRRVSGPPFHLTINADRFPPGAHTLRLEAVDRVGPTGLAVEVPVTVAGR